MWTPQWRADEDVSKLFESMTVIYGTVLRDMNLELYWSPWEWHSPKDGKAAQPDKWLHIQRCSPEYRKLLKLAKSLPQYHGEYDYFYPQEGK